MKRILDFNLNLKKDRLSQKIPLEKKYFLCQNMNIKVETFFNELISEVYLLQIIKKQLVNEPTIVLRI